MDENALAEQVSGDDETDLSGAEDVGFANEQEAPGGGQEDPHDQDDPYGVKKRLGMQAKKHAREMRQMQEQMMQMQAQFSGGEQGNQQSGYDSPPFNSPGQPNPPPMSEEEKIHKAVRMALGQKDHEERQAKEAQKMAHVHKQYQRLNNEFDQASEKYEDFDDVVRGDDVPFTKDIRDLLLFTENPAEVAYKLGKNRKELERISELHPIDMAREINKLSFSLMGGNSGKSAPSKSTPMGSVRVNPANSSGAVTDKTPPSAIRARMKAGTWK